MRTVLCLLATWLISPTIACAASSLTYVHDHHILTVRSSDMQGWRAPLSSWTYRGAPATPPRSLSGVLLPPLWQKTTTRQWDREAIRISLNRRVYDVLHRDAGSVVIRRSASGAIVFDGVGLPGRDILMDQLIDMTILALEHDVTTIVIPVVETSPSIAIQDRTLQSLGVNDVVMVGESDFSGSPKNREHNIHVGAEKFNGHLILKGDVFSFDSVLGPVNEKTGFKKELVIQGDRTLPDYGGGLCQVSSTAYRGPWEYGLPILKRRNHSYAVRYYSPQGTDATIYPPNVDLRFQIGRAHV